MQVRRLEFGIDQFLESAVSYCGDDDLQGRPRFSTEVELEGRGSRVIFQFKPSRLLTDQRLLSQLRFRSGITARARDDLSQCWLLLGTSVHFGICIQMATTQT